MLTHRKILENGSQNGGNIPVLAQWGKPATLCQALIAKTANMKLLMQI